MKFPEINFLQPTILLALALMAIIVMMILPVPAWVLDMGLAVSFGLAILIFTVTLFIERPLDFSSFPTVLLASLMLRLSLNVSSTKLIIGQGHTGTHAAGSVIEGFASFVMGGSILLGLVVFCVLLIVNFVVITKGATRMAEVGARFALDGMPGKQLAIDADVSAGAIDHAEAKARRELEQAETTFFGSLDGASKFVKGDAVAGLLITLLNLVMGLVIGVAVHDLSLGVAFETYAILTVGDGLVSQIPAVIISIAAALLLARGGATGAADSALLQQLGKYPKALITVAALLALFAFVPGLPFVPFILGAGVLAGAGFWVYKDSLENGQGDDVEETPPEEPEKTGDLLDLDEIHVQFAPDLVNLALDPATGLEARIGRMRDHIAKTFGVILPEIRLTDAPELPSNTYVINLLGVQQAEATLFPEKVMVLLGQDTDALPGEVVKEPVYGAPAKWMDRSDEDELAISGYTVIAPGEVLATHLLEVIKSNFSKLFGLRSLQKLLREFSNLSDPVRSAANRQLLDDLVPEKVPMETLLSVVKLLLAERVSVRNLALILESLAEIKASNLSPDALCEHVRQRLAFQITSEFRRSDGSLPVLQLAHEWEAAFSEHQSLRDGGVVDIALPPDAFGRLSRSLVDKVSELGERGEYPAIVTSALRRRYVQTIARSRGVSNPVLSYEELSEVDQPAVLGVIAA